MTRKSDESSSPANNDVSSRSSRHNGTTAGSGSKPKLKDHTKIIQVANVAPQATREQMQTLFDYVGKIDDLRLYPTVDLGIAVSSKICFVKFYDASSVGVAQHLTNTVFIDRALIVIPFTEGDVIPDEQKSLELLTSGSLLPGIADPKLPQHVTSQMDPYQGVIVTIDPKLKENGLPPYPNLPSNIDNRKIEEIRRSVLIANLDTTLGAQEIVDYFSMAGEVKYFRFCTRDNDPIHYALMEFKEQPEILKALKMNGNQVGNKFIKVYHAVQAIQKPQVAKTNEAAQKEIEDAMALRAQTLMSQGLGLDANSMDTSITGIIRDRTSGPYIRNRSRSRSRSRSRRRSLSWSRLRRYSRSRSRDRSRRRRSRSSSRSRKRASKSSSKRSRSKSKERSKRSKSKDRRRSRSRSRSRGKHTSRSRSRSTRSKKRDEKDKDSDRDKKKPKNDQDREKERDKSDKKEKNDLDQEKTTKLEGRREKENDTSLGVDLDDKWD